MLRKFAIKRNTQASSEIEARNEDDACITVSSSHNSATSAMEETSKLFSSSDQHVGSEEEILPFIVDYLGFDHISEAQSVPLMKETLKKIKKHHTKSLRVDFVIHDGILKVSDVTQGALLITAPLYAVALCAQEQLRGFDSTFAINITRRRVHLCHVFQAGSRLEASSIVRSVALAFKSVGKLLKEKRERILLAESSSSSERLRTESDGSRYRERNRTESEGSREKHRINIGDVPASKKRHLALPGGARNKAGIVASSLAGTQIEDTADPVNRNEIVTALVQRDNLGKRQQYAESSSKESFGIRANSTEVYSDREKDSSGEGEGRDGADERRGSVASSREKHYWDDDIKSSDVSKIDDLYAVAASCIESGNYRQLEILIDSGLAINSKDINEFSLLHHAAVRNQVEITTLLLERGADPNCEGPSDQTPLHCAAGQGNRAIAKVLLEFGANVRAKDRLFRTPLHMCAGNLQSLEVSFLLVEHGARIEDNDLEGTRPVDLQLELQEMQNRLIQSACEAFTATDLSKSRSDSGSSSSRSNSMRSGKSLLPSQQGRRGLHKSNSFKRHSISLHSIPDDNSDEDETLKDGCNRDGQVIGFSADESNASSTKSSKKTMKQESFDCETESSRDEPYIPYQAIDLRKVNDKYTRKYENRVNEKFLEHFRSGRNMLDEPLNLPSDSECSVDSTKVEIDSLCLDDEEFAPSMIQDFKYDDTSTRSVEGFLDSNLNVMGQKDDILDLRNGDLSRIRTSTKKEESGSSDVIDSTENSLAGSNHDLSDDTTISDSESITRLRESLHSKLPRTDRSSFSSYSKLFKKDPASDALKLLVTLSLNPECHSSILASLCLPNTAGQVVAAAHSPRTSSYHLDQIASLLGNLFTVSGPDIKRKAVEAGLLKTVIDMLDTPEPVQGTCLSILNDLLQTESEREYSMAITNVPIEPLLSILEKETPSKKSVSEKLQLYQEKTPMPYGDSSALSARKVAHHIYFQEKEPELVASKSMKRELKFYLDKRVSDKEMNSQSLKLVDTNPHIHFMPPPDGLGRGRSDSFSSQSSRESSPSSMGKVSSKSNSVSDVRLSESLAGAIMRQRRSSRGSGYSTDGSTISNLIASHQLCQPMAAKNIAVKMLSAVSNNPKLQQELAKPRIIQILLGCSKDSDFEISLQSTMALANMAMNVNTHAQLESEHVVEGLELNTKHNNIRVRYNAARGLIYLGHFNINGIHIFSALEADESLSNVIYSEATSQQEQYFVRGTSIESLVLMLKKDIHLLWGGSTLPPPSPGDKKNGMRAGVSVPGKEGIRHAPTEQQILNFILTMYPTFAHPVIFMRLLLHRFHDPTYYKIFEEYEETGQVICMGNLAPLPPVHARLIRVWVTWLETHPGDFRRCPTMLEELGDLVEPMRAVGGPYVPCAERLEALMNKIKEDGSSRGSERSSHSENYHDALYEQCQKAIVSGSIPSTEDYFVYLASLQLYIEDLEEYGQDFPQRINTISSITSARLKQSIHPSLASSKNVLKRIKLQYEVILEESPTMRNAKHNYIDCCQGIEGFGCRFFKLKQRVPTKGGKNYNTVTRLLGISSKRVAILDEQTKACIEKWNFKDLKRWGTTEDNLYLRLTFKKRTVEFQMDSKSIFKELSNYILTCSMEMGRQGFGNFDTSPWSPYAERTGTWGVPALRLYLSELRRELDNSPTGKVESPLSCRERAITYIPSSGARPPLQRSKSYGVTEVSKSAPGQIEPDAEITSSAFDWFPFRSRKSRACSGKSELSTHGGIVTEYSAIQSPQLEGTSPRRTKPRKSSSSPKSHIEFTPVSVFEQHLSSPSHASSSVLSQSSNERAPMLDVSAEQESTKAVEKIQKDYCKAVARINYCRCPPDAQLPNLNRRDFSAFELLQHPKELARQITLIDHELFRAMSSRDIQKKISIGTLRKLKGDNSSQTVEKVAQRFNQLSNWVCVCIVSERNIDRRAQMFINFVETAKQCLELRNYNSVMAIVVAALGSAPVRRLKNTKEKIPPECLSQLNKMENLMDTKSNHKKYREALRTSPTPAVPYFGLYLKDLTFITDGNPDYLTNGLINLNKRRQVYLLLDEIHRFQKKKYNFQKVPEVRDYLYNRPNIPEEQLHKMSREIEPPIHAKYPATSASQPNTGLQANLFRSSAPRVMGRRTLGIMKAQVHNVAV
ncbi:uncharacterized protein LOC135695275 isoform X1 [Rhopilema esculentum]|uniref:uncharacterized protein LOC135695275 isoform X1 n=1 Tax=Rhopilema esculentum TaxID=499914 RepID=UPI0031E41B0C